MNVVFADTFYYLAYLGERDSAHERAIRFSQTYSGWTVTTAWVLAELADALAAPETRSNCAAFINALYEDAAVQIVPPSAALFQRGLDLYAARTDKEWSLTDCLSFVVMDEHRVRDALTGDHHFEQAGFAALLK
jgi:uncharacterized protein